MEDSVMAFSRRSALRLLALGGLGLLPSVAARPTAHAASPVTILFWESTNAQEKAFTDPVVAAWNTSHPAIQIKIQNIPAGNSTEEVFASAIAARKTPDITNNLLPAVVPQYASEGGLYQMDKLPDFVSYMTARMPAGSLQQFKSTDGHYYQIPWKANPVMLIYRTDLLKKAGYASFPHTYTTFLAMLKAVKSKTNVNPLFPTIDQTWYQRFFDFYPFYLAQSNGTPLLNSSANKSVFQDHGAAQVMSLWRQIFAQNLVPKSASAAEKWAVGHQAINIAGPWGPNGEVYQHNAGNLPWNVASIPVPDSMKNAPAYPYTFSDPKNITVFASSKHPQQAWEFVKYYINSANDKAFLNKTWEFPYRKELVDNPTSYSALFKQYPQLVQFAKQLPYTRGLDNSPKFIQVFDAISQAWGSAVVNGSKSPAAAVQSAANTINGIVAGGANGGP
jgi:multiple sugar transport system substrate-binding protein